MRDFIMRRDYNTCQVCGDTVSNRKVVDHIAPLKVAPERRLDAENLWVLCYKCHTIKTRVEYVFLENRRRKNKMLPHLSREWWTKAIKERR